MKSEAKQARISQRSWVPLLYAMRGLPEMRTTGRAKREIVRMMLKRDRTA